MKRFLHMGNATCVMEILTYLIICELPTDDRDQLEDYAAYYQAGVVDE